jgi:hypothetical protein
VLCCSCTVCHISIAPATLLLVLLLCTNCACAYSALSSCLSCKEVVKCTSETLNPAVSNGCVTLAHCRSDEFCLQHHCASHILTAFWAVAAKVTCHGVHTDASAYTHISCKLCSNAVVACMHNVVHCGRRCFERRLPLYTV